jgi:predicted transcriptional regulator
MSPKRGSKTITQARLLTEVELELMNIIWSLDKVTVKDIVLQLPKERALAYTTVATVVKVLEQKGFLECKKNSYAHVFLPLVTKAEYESTCIVHTLTHVFDGKPAALVQRLLMAKKLQHEDIQAIEEALKQLATSEQPIEA